MKKLFYSFISLSLLFVISCATNNAKETIQPAQTTTPKVNNSYSKEANSQLSKSAINDLKKIKKLYDELMRFKGTSNFISYGFDINGEYYYWINEVRNLRENNKNDSQFMQRCGFVIGDLEMLGMTYASDKGKESDYTSYMRESLEKAFNENLD